jgi:hypothetical protein
MHIHFLKESFSGHLIESFGKVEEYRIKRLASVHRRRHLFKEREQISGTAFTWHESMLTLSDKPVLF